MASTSRPGPPNDPLNVLQDGPMAVVKVQNTTREDLNGKLAIAVQFLPDRGRYMVLLTATQQNMALKPDNLVKGSYLETFQAQWQQLRNDPQVKRELTRYYNLAQSKLPARVKPEYALAAGLVVIAILMYFVGFTKVLMAISMMIMLGLIIGPDLPQGWGVVWANFPSRSKTTVEATIPLLKGRINEKAAAALVVFFLVMTIQAVLRPSKVAVVPPMSSSSGATTGAAANSAVTIQQNAYKLGFEDATNGKDFGTSLPLDPTTPLEAAASPRKLGVDTDGASSYFDPSSYSMPSSPSSPMQKFGISQVISLGVLGFQAMRLGRDVHGVFSPQLLLANLRTTPPMQLAVLIFPIYNILKIFF